MHLFLALASTLSVLALASPIPEDAKSMMAAGPQWTVQSFTRTCNGANTSCKFKYSINTHSSPATSCVYTINASGARTANYGNVHCGPYTISSGWSGQFGPGNGFTTLAVTNNQQIIYPAYTDKQLVDGKAVIPDQSYTPQNLP